MRGNTEQWRPANGPTSPSPPARRQNAAAAPAPTTPRATLHAAQAAFTRHDYATAESLSRSILSTAKSSPEAYQAQFLLAQSLSGEGKPQDAAIAFDNAYNLNRTGAEAPQALLGLADLARAKSTRTRRPATRCLAQQPVPHAACRACRAVSMPPATGRIARNATAHHPAGQNRQDAFTLNIA